MTRTAFLTAFFAIALAACGTDSVGVEVRAITNDPGGQLVAVDDGSAAYALETAYLRLRNIELDVAGTDETVDIGGPFEIDLVTGESTPSLDDVQIPAGTYERIDFRVEDNPADVSFAVTAAFEHEGDALTLELSLDFNEDIRIEEQGGTSVDGDTDLIAEFVVDNWLAGVDIGACIDDGDVVREGDVVRVDESSTSGRCSDIEDTIKKNMKDSGQFDRD